MTEDEALIREQIAQTREDLAEKVEAIRAKVDVRHRGEQKLRSWQAALTASVKQFRHGFAGSRATDGNHSTPGPATTDNNTTFAAETGRVEPALLAGPEAHRDAARRGARARELGEAAVAAGWRRKTAEGIAPRVAGSAPISGGAVKAAIGLVFLAMSGSYVLKTFFTALRHRDVDQAQPSPRAVRRSQRPTYLVASSSQHPRAYHRTRRTPSRRGGKF